MSDPTRTVVATIGGSPPEANPRPGSGSFPSAKDLADLQALLSPPRDAGEIGRLSHFRLLRPIGAGGMGMVLLAEDMDLDRHVALKVVLPRFAKSAEARDRFLREARAAAGIRHDNVVTIHQVGEEHGVLFMAMELLNGASLDAFLTGAAQFPPAEVLRVAREAANGLAAAHARGLIHRDIKPANIWIEQGGRVKLLDFGLVRGPAGDLRLTRSGAVLGTPAYMSPEQAGGESVDARTDLFSLGVVLYQMTSGRRPFERPDLASTLLAIRNDPHPSIAALVPSTPVRLVELIDRLLAKNPQDRPATAAEVATLAEVAARDVPAVPPQEALRPDNSPSPVVPASWDALNTASLAVDDTSPALEDAPRPNRRGFFIGAATAAAIAAGAVGYQVYRNRRNAAASAGSDAIVVGILHSLTGALRTSAIPVMQVTQTAIDRINEQGGLLGRPVRYVIRDAAFDERAAVTEAERLITRDRVRAIFGGWSARVRKAVTRVVERHDNLLLYPVHYEGMERSPNVVYTGATPNQLVLPAVDWCLRRTANATFFLIGSDHIYSRCTTKLIRNRVESKGGKVVGEHYAPVGGDDFRPVCGEIKTAAPDFILNTLYAADNEAFFPALRSQGVNSADSPTVSFTLDAEMLRGFRTKVVAGDYAACSYFESIPGERNAAFVSMHRDRWGTTDAVTDTMEAAYVSVCFWAQAVVEAGSADPVAVRKSILGQTMDAPGGDGVRIDPENRHAWKYFRLGQITPDGRLDIVFEDEAPTAPTPFPEPHTPEEWERFQLDLYKRWGNRWAAS